MWWHEYEKNVPIDKGVKRGKGGVRARAEGGGGLGMRKNLSLDRTSRHYVSTF